LVDLFIWQDSNSAARCAEQGKAMTEQRFPSHADLFADLFQELGLPPLMSGSPFEQASQFQQKPLAYLRTVLAAYQDIVCLFLPTPTILVTHPRYVYQILQASLHVYHKAESSQRLFGEGLVTSNGDTWRRQRRLLQPAFHHRHQARWGAIMIRATQAMLTRWEPFARDQEPLDITHEMARLSLSILCEAIFGVDVSHKSAEIGQAITTLLTTPDQPDHAAEIEAAMQVLDTVVAHLIQARRANSASQQDVLALLLRAQQENDTFVTEALVRDELVTFLIAGHETTAAGLAWAWYLFAQHPAVEGRLHQELRHVLAGAAPTPTDVPRLSYTRMVLEESLRIYPPVPLTSRIAKTDAILGPYRIPAGARLLLSPYLTHRHSDVWTRPEDFDPERFSLERSAGRPPCAHFPFGFGPRVCIGASFAWLEMVTIVALVAQRYRLRLASGIPITPVPRLSLHPENGLPMVLERLV
jgi:cytochrome P450